MQTYPAVDKVAYEMIRNEIQSADLLFCSGQSAMSRMIRAATESVWSHIGFVLRVENINRVLVLESVESIGVRTVPLSHYILDYNASGKGYKGRLFLARDHRFALLPPEALCHFSQTAVDLFGYGYDSQEITRIALKIVSKKLGIRTRKHKPNRLYICSEYVAECYTSVGITLDTMLSAFITPSDFANSPYIDFLWELQSAAP